MPLPEIESPEADARPSSPPPSTEQRAQAAEISEKAADSRGEPSGELAAAGELKRSEEENVDGDDDDDEEEETCGFCRYMKGGGCKEQFVAWMECVDREKEGGGDYVEECIPPMQALRECMLANPDYYGPMLEEEENRIKEREAEQGEEDPEMEGASEGDKSDNAETHQDATMSREGLGSNQDSSEADPESNPGEILTKPEAGNGSSKGAKVMD